MKLKSDKTLYIVLFFISAAWLCIFLQMTPLMDDWSYVTTPLGGTLTLVRPIDELIAVILKAFPFLFPWFNRSLLAVLHFINCIIFHRFTVDVLKQKRYTGVFTLLFSISPWIYAAIAQTDSVNQVIMFTFGIIGTYYYFMADNELRANIFYIIFTALSLCAKESGAAFLAVTPAIILIKVIHGELEFRAAIRRMFRSYLLGIVLFAVYFIAFFVLRTYSSLPYDRRSLRMLFAKIIYPIAGFTGVNTIDIYNGFWLNTAFVLVLSVPLVLYAFANFVKLAKNKSILKFTAIVLFVFGELFLLPSQLFYIMTDMHMYPLAFFALLIILYFIPKDRKRLTIVLLAMYFMSFVISNAEKIYWQNISSGYVREFQAEASELIGNDPAKIYVICPDSSICETGVTYHAIADAWFMAYGNGKSLHSVYGYDTPILSSVYKSVDDIEDMIKSAPDGYTSLVVYPDKSLKVIK